MRGKARTGHDQNAGSGPVQAMHQAWFLAAAVAERIQHAVHMARQPRAALNRQTLRFVEDKQVVVLMQDQRAQSCGIVSAG